MKGIPKNTKKKKFTFFEIEIQSSEDGLLVL